MLSFLAHNPLLLLFLIAGTGYILGRINIFGLRFGTSAVLFTGLTANAIDPSLQLPDIIGTLGLVLMVYTMGLYSGPNFVATVRKQGLRDVLFASATLAFTVAVLIGMREMLGFSGGIASGLFSGALTNTAGLASAIDFLKDHYPPAVADMKIVDPVVAYSLSYPFGVFGVIAAVYLAQRIWRVDYKQEAAVMREWGVSSEPLMVGTIRIVKEDATKAPLIELLYKHGWQVVFGRIYRGSGVWLVDTETNARIGDLVRIVGTPSEIQRVVGELGELEDDTDLLPESDYETRSFFLSNSDIAGKRIVELEVPAKFGARIMRVRRGDLDRIPTGNMRLELGDQVRVMVPRDRQDELAKFFGDSYKGLSEIDIAVFSLGITLGLVLGSITIPLPGELEIKLGFSGGPLIVGLLLGTLGRSGRIVWTLPYNANLTLRQLGLILFLASAGTRSGSAFIDTLLHGEGVRLLILGAIVTTAMVLFSLFVGHKILRMPMSLLMGATAGIQTQPTVLAFAGEHSRNELPTIGYSSVYPVALILKIIVAQLLVW